MTGRNNVTRVDLYAAVYEKVNLSRSKSLALVELVLKEVTDTLAKGETVKLASFGSFIVRSKNQRIGRNPKTGTEVPISPRRIVVFKPSAILKGQINGKRSGTKAPVTDLDSSAQAAEERSADVRS
jgi:integration host factor subunit alpha